jgi:monoamine oxidase
MRKPKNSLLKILMDKLNKSVVDNRQLEQTAEAYQYTRRKFISDSAKGVAALGMLVALPSVLTACQENEQDTADNNSKDNNVINVAIIGAGIAGLNCAYNLHKSTIDFTVFEASARVGGRILTHYNDSLGVGIFPEFGGDFIDSNHKDMLELAKEFNLELIDLEKEQQANNLQKDVYFFDNRNISEKEVINEFAKIAKKISNDKDSLGENYDTDVAVKLDNTPLSDYINGLQCQAWLKELLVAAFIAEFGLDCHEQSTLNLLDMINPDTSNGFQVFGESDERYRIKAGNSKIIENLMTKIGDNKIKKEYALIEISDTDTGKYKLSFANNESVIAEKVVITIPFTMLRKVTMNLKALSKEKKQCIDELGYGMNTKLVLAYNGMPWRDKPNNAMGYLFHKEIVNGWDCSHNKTPDNNYGAYICYFGGAFSENLNKESSKNKLAPAWHLWKTELPSNIIDGMVNELDKVFLNSKEKFVDKHVFVNWIDYPYTKGSYSCYKTGQWTTIAGQEFKPIGNVHFAGEHCSEDFQGYMNGGAETGRRVAENIKMSLAIGNSVAG